MVATVVGARTREFLSRQGLPTGDRQATAPPDRSFSGGGKFGIELSSVNNAAILRTTLELAKEHSIRVNRCDECRGIGRLPDADIVEMVRICAGEAIGLLLSIGPRAIYDTAASSGAATVAASAIDSAGWRASFAPSRRSGGRRTSGCAASWCTTRACSRC